MVPSKRSLRRVWSGWIDLPHRRRDPLTAADAGELRRAFFYGVQAVAR